MKPLRLAYWLFAFAALCAMPVCVRGETRTVYLDALNWRLADTGRGKVRPKRAMTGYPMSIAGQPFKQGVGVHAFSHFRFMLDGQATRLESFVGIDDRASSASASADFRIYGDDRELWRSGILRWGDKARTVSVDLTGVRQLTLYVSDGGDTIEGDHANWADGRMIYDGAAPEAVANFPVEAVILTPTPSPAPRINGPRVYGARPGAPFQYSIPVTGERPMTFSIKGLPSSLSMDAQGRITGTAPKAGAYGTTITARNNHGQAIRSLRLLVGDRIALTPPMGWNSWNCWGKIVDAEKVAAAARAMRSSGLADHGWTYINIDDTWQSARRGGPHHAIQGNERFPDMAGLIRFIHDQGLKAGIYSTPWVTSYAGFLGGGSKHADGAWNPYEDGLEFGQYSFVENDVRQWVDWGIDYLKYDWDPNDPPHAMEMGRALRACGRDIVYSLSNSAPFEHAAVWAEWANTWRTTDDITDTWQSILQIGFYQDRWAPFGGPGHWNDADMLVVGQVGWGMDFRPSRLTPDEQYTHISLWCLLASPLLLGCDLNALDAFTYSLLTNDEVLAVNQDTLGRQAVRVARRDDTIVMARPLADGSQAVGLFNLRPVSADVFVRWNEINRTGPAAVRDVWRQKDLGVFEDRFSARIPSHGVRLLRVWNRD